MCDGWRSLANGKVRARRRCRVQNVTCLVVADDRTQNGQEQVCGVHILFSCYWWRHTPTLQPLLPSSSSAISCRLYRALFIQWNRVTSYPVYNVLRFTTYSFTGLGLADKTYGQSGYNVLSLRFCRPRWYVVMRLHCIAVVSNYKDEINVQVARLK